MKRKLAIATVFLASSLSAFAGPKVTELREPFVAGHYGASFTGGEIINPARVPRMANINSCTVLFTQNLNTTHSLLGFNDNRTVDDGGIRIPIKKDDDSSFDSYSVTYQGTNKKISFSVQSDIGTLGGHLIIDTYSKSVTSYKLTGLELYKSGMRPIGGAIMSERLVTVECDDLHPGEYYCPGRGCGQGDF